MTENYYNLYIQSILNLAETIVIKSDDTADALNVIVKTIYGVDKVNTLDKSTWKYYQNICGIYHFSDEPMFVTSVDTLQTIRFTSDNLKIHTATKKAYQYGTRSYNELVSLFPDKETLILGILYPADMNKAVSSVDGTVLSYPPKLIESNEVSLVKNIELWVKRYKQRWYNTQFSVSDSLYIATHLGLMYLNLVPLIINLRLKACKTSETHSFHVRQYLASHGMLDLYLDSMTVKQSLFFYRNISYIERNNGKKFILEWLIENIMTQRRLPIGEMVMRHDVSKMPTMIKPIITFEKKPLNISFNSNDKKDYSLTEIFDKEILIKPGNTDYIDERGLSIEKTLVNSLSNVVGTKILDSSVIDYSNATPYTFEDTAINHWLSFSTNGFYNTFVTIRNPRTGRQISVQCKDAFTYFIYCFDRALGSNISVIPLLFAQRVTRQPRPSVADIYSVVDKKYVSISDVQTILNLQPFISKSVSVEAFLEVIKSLFNAAQYQLRFVASQQDQYKRGLMQGAVMRTYCNKFCRVVPDNTLYVDWLIEKNLPTETFTRTEYLELYKQLYETVVGTDLDSSAKLTNLQNAMIGLLKQLSSYSIQFTSEVIGSNLKVLNLGVANLGDIDNESTQRLYLTEVDADILEQDNSSSTRINYEIEAPKVSFDNKNVGLQSEKIEINVKTKLDEEPFTLFQNVSIGALSVGILYADSLRNIPNDPGFIGFNDPLVLANSRLGFFKDIYDNCFENPTDRRVDLTSSMSFEAFTLFGDEVELSAFRAITGIYYLKSFKLRGSQTSVGQFKLSGNTNSIS